MTSAALIGDRLILEPGSISLLSDDMVRDVFVLHGGHGEFIETAAEIGDALQRTLDSGRPACLNIVTDIAATGD